jgi:hypothetical protein
MLLNQVNQVNHLFRLGPFSHRNPTCFTDLIGDGSTTPKIRELRVVRRGDLRHQIMGKKHGNPWDFPMYLPLIYLIYTQCIEYLFVILVFHYIYMFVIYSPYMVFSYDILVRNKMIINRINKRKMDFQCVAG